MMYCIIYHSETGNTRHVAQHLASACGDPYLIEVGDRGDYQPLTQFLIRCKRAQGEETTPIEPSTIDVTGFDIIVMGSPVWAWKPTPVINAAIAALKDCEGKKAVIYATCGSQAGETIEIMRKALEEKGVKVVGDIVFDKKTVRDGKKINELIVMVNAAAIA